MNHKDVERLNERNARVALRCSHFIWICRNTKTWETLNCSGVEIRTSVLTLFAPLSCFLLF